MSTDCGMPSTKQLEVERKALLSVQKSIDAWLMTKSGFYEMEVRPFLPDISEAVIAGFVKDGVTLS